MEHACSVMPGRWNLEAVLQLWCKVKVIRAALLGWANLFCEEVAIQSACYIRRSFVAAKGGSDSIKGLS
jgi:hypothetical protein